MTRQCVALGVASLLGIFASDAWGNACEGLTTQSKPDQVVLCIKELEKKSGSGSASAADAPKAERGPADLHKPQKLRADLGQVQAIVNIPIGGIVQFAGPIDNPTTRDELEKQGWLPCDGKTVDKEKYKALYRVIGDLYGSASAAGQFKLPDLHGQFLRGLDPTSMVDPGRKLGTSQHFATASPKNLKLGGDITPQHEWKASAVQVGLNPHMSVNIAGWDTETRPVNIAVNFLIRAHQ